MKVAVIVVFSFFLGFVSAILQDHLNEVPKDEELYNKVDELTEAARLTKNKIRDLKNQLKKQINKKPEIIQQFTTVYSEQNPSKPDREQSVQIKSAQPELVNNTPHLDQSTLDLETIERMVNSSVNKKFEKLDWDLFSNKFTEHIVTKSGGRLPHFLKKNRVEFLPSMTPSEKLNQILQTIGSNSSEYNLRSVKNQMNEIEKVSFEDYSKAWEKELRNKSAMTWSLTKIMIQKFPEKSKRMFKDIVETSQYSSDLDALETALQLLSYIYGDTDLNAKSIAEVIASQLLEQARLGNVKNAIEVSELLLIRGAKGVMDYISFLLNSQNTRNDEKEELMEVLDDYTDEDLPWNANDAHKVVTWIEVNKASLVWDADSEWFYLVGEEGEEEQEEGVLRKATQFASTE